MFIRTLLIIYLLKLYILLNCFSRTNGYLQYQFKLNVGKLCPAKNYTCGNGKPHFLCRARKKARCENFQNIPVEGKLQRSFIMGHNGIRNKVAEDWGIANMNLVHWSRSLATMAQFYLKQCEVNADTCSIIGDNHLKVNQNYAIRHQLVQRWPGRVVRSWYMEISYDVRNFQQFLIYHKVHNVANFTQMVWPELEFIGCAAAFIKNSYFLIVCYYYPPYEANNLTEVFKFGKPCTKCMITRNACSLTFLGLCGIDVDLPDSSCVQSPEIKLIILLCCILLCITNSLYLK